MARWYWHHFPRRPLVVTYGASPSVTVHWDRIIGVRIGRYFIGLIGAPPRILEDLPADNGGQP